MSLGTEQGIFEYCRLDGLEDTHVLSPSRTAVFRATAYH